MSDNRSVFALGVAAATVGFHLSHLADYRYRINQKTCRLIQVNGWFFAQTVSSAGLAGRFHGLFEISGFTLRQSATKSSILSNRLKVCELRKII